MVETTMETMKGFKVIPKAIFWIIGNLIWVITSVLEYGWRACQYIVYKW